MASLSSRELHLLTGNIPGYFKGWSRNGKNGGAIIMERIIAFGLLILLVGLSIAKGILGIDDASTVLISTIAGAVLGYYFGKPNSGRNSGP